MSVQLSILNRTRARVDTVWLARHLRKALRMLGVRKGEWSVIVVGDKEMKALHMKTMGLGSTTDVLTFDLRDQEAVEETAEGCDMELDTVVCLDEAKRRGAELGHSAMQELLLYGVHSLLHVQGFDDVTKGGAVKMHRREDEVLIALSIGALYRKTPRKIL